MRTTFTSGLTIPVGLIMMAVWAFAPPAPAQVRGVYPQGMNATNSGVTPEPGFTYSNIFILFSRDELKGPQGEVLATGENSVMMDMNSFVWVSERQIEMLGGARFSFSATLPIANNSLTSDTAGRAKRRWWIRRLLLSAVHPRLAEKARRDSGSLWVPGAHRKIPGRSE